MITFKCKMCGGDLSFEPGASVAECPYCGTNQTLPKLDDDKRANLYDRANHFRRQNEYDKAASIYEQILAEDRTDAEAWWSLVLCRYGIEYVEDPASHKRVPTVNRAQYASILADEDYKSALNYADTLQKGVYEAEANAIAEIQKGILDISKKEEPFDVFICYKETDANGRRTPDSVLANDMYHQLTKEGFKVFFSRITLEDKIGTAYEPYIFAALNSAKVMVVLGTKTEYFNAVWVKNEWSRYLALIRSGADKILVPAYRDMDPYDLPEEFAHLQAQDMGKLGFMQDLIRGIKKILRKDEPRQVQSVVQQVVAGGGANIDNLMKRARLFMEDGDWASANEYLNKVLDENAEYAPAYAGKVQATMQLRKESELSSCLKVYESSADWQKALRFAAPEQKKVYEGYVDGAKAAREEKRKSEIYDAAQKTLRGATTPEACAKAKGIFAQIPGYRDADDKQRECVEKANQILYQDVDRLASELMSESASEQTAARWEQLSGAFAGIRWGDAKQRADQCIERAGAIRDEVYAHAARMLKEANEPQDCDRAKSRFAELGGYRDAQAQAAACDQKKGQIQAQIDAQRERERREAEARAKAEATKRRTRTIVILLLIVTIAAGTFAYIRIIKPNMAYKNAVALQQSGKYEEAIAAFEALGSYSDAAEQIKETNYLHAKALMANEDYAGAVSILTLIKGYRDVDSIIENDDNIAAAAAAAWRAQFDAGNTVQFGHYEQDNNTSNGAEAIEWIVLANDGDTATLISKYGLDAKPYNTEYEGVTWESCTLRKWLNGDFLNVAFSAEEQARLETVTVTADKNPKYDTNPGNDTQDKVYLLSIDEANTHFSSDDARWCQATAYAKTHGAYVGNSGDSRWWLRSPGYNGNYAAFVGSGGSFGSRGRNVNYGNDVVRPVVVLRLS